MKLLAFRFVFFKLPRSFFHLFSKTERSHISPHLFYVSQAFGFCAHLADIAPAEWVLLMLRPYRVLFVVVYYDSVDCRIFIFQDFAGSWWSPFFLLDILRDSRRRAESDH